MTDVKTQMKRWMQSPALGGSVPELRSQGQSMSQLGQVGGIVGSVGDFIGAQSTTPP
ncbi:MAG: hypothetical protein ACLSAH_10180 [Bilophila wadsworthia]